MNREKLRETIIVHDDGEQKLYFTEWVKYREDTPPEMKVFFDKAGAKIGDSLPMYCDDPDKALRFADPEMAMQVMKKQQDMYPSWKDQLYSIPWVSRHGKTAEDRLLNAMFMDRPELREAE